MKTKLFKGLSEEQTKELERQYKASFLLREQIVLTLKQEREAIVQKMTKDEFGPKWEIEQAYRIAEIKHIDKLISLF